MINGSLIWLPMVVRALPSPSRGARCACRGRVAMWLVPEQARTRSAPGVTKGDRRSPWAPKDSTAAPTDTVRGRLPIRCHALADLSPTRGRCAANTSHRHPAGGGDCRGPQDSRCLGGSDVLVTTMDAPSQPKAARLEGCIDLPMPQTTSPPDLGGPMAGDHVRIY